MERPNKGFIEAFEKIIMNTVKLRNELGNEVSIDKITPSKIVCIGRNYVDHIAELGNEIPEELVVFTKTNSAISTELQSFHQEKLHYEGELCFMFSQGKFGAVAFGLDLTKRTLQSQLKAKGLPWERAKSFDGAVVFSQFAPIDTVDLTLRLELEINSSLQQAGGVNLMMVKPNEILAQLKQFMTLEDGDIVMTGTPKGVGEIVAGDEFTGRIFCKNQLMCSETWVAV